MQKTIFLIVSLISFLISLDAVYLKEEPKVPPCYYKNMGGELPEQVCQLREFLKALPPFDSTKKEDSISNALLFSGEPGTGKTMGAEQLAIESEAFIIPVILSDVADEAALISQKIDSLYKQAEQKIKEYKRPVILLFDDAELSSEHNKAILILNSFIDKQYKNPYIMTIVTMNKDITQLDKGFKDRSRLVQWPLPSYEKRVAIITFFKKRYECVMDQKGINSLAQQTDGFSCRNLEKIFEDAKKRAEREDAVFFGRKHLEQEIKKRRNELETEAVNLPPLSNNDLSWGQRHPYLKKTGEVIGSAAVGAIAVILYFMGGSGGGSGDSGS